MGGANKRCTTGGVLHAFLHAAVISKDYHKAIPISTEDTKGGGGNIKYTTTATTSHMPLAEDNFNNGIASAT